MTTTARTKLSGLSEVYFTGFVINVAIVVILSFFFAVEPQQYYYGHPEYKPAKHYDTIVSGALGIFFFFKYATLGEEPIHLIKDIKHKIRKEIKTYRQWRGKC
jgi:hypothetical protein